MRPRTILKEITYGTAHALGLPLLGTRRPHRTLKVLTYHSFGPAEPYPYLPRLPVERFKAQIRYLRRHYRLVGLRDGLRQLVEPPDRLDQRSMVAVTIDDGYGDNFEHLFPLLREEDIPVTIFVATDYVDNGRLPWPSRIGALLHFATRQNLTEPMALTLRTPKDRAYAGAALRQYFSRLCSTDREHALATVERELAPSHYAPVPALTWEQIREMTRHGVAFGSHTRFHGWLDRLEPPEVEDELVHSKQRLEAELTAPCDLFAYPNGNCSEQVAAAVARAGYKYALTQDRGVNGAAALRPHRLHRNEVPADEWIGSFACRVGGIAL